MLNFEAALASLLDAVRPVGDVLTLPTIAATNQVLAVQQRSAINIPSFDNSAMDGYAVRTSDVPVVGSRLPISQRIFAGAVGGSLQPATAARIFTGAPLPPGADAVVVQECCEESDGVVMVNMVPQPGSHVRRAGEEIVADEVVLPKGIRLRSQDIALLASTGIARVPVFRRPRVAILFTGDELQMPGESLRPGAIYNSNRFALKSLLERLNCEVRDLGQVADDLVATQALLREAAIDSDLILTSGGVSVGDADFVKLAVVAEGKLDLWKVAIKPGKPLAFGEISTHGAAAAFIGLPGNPVSAFVTFLMLVRPYVLRLAGVADVAPRSFSLCSNFDWLSPDARREFLRCRMGSNGGVDIFPNQGSNALTNMVWADGFVNNPPGQVIQAGDMVNFIPFSELLN